MTKKNPRKSVKDRIQDGIRDLNNAGIEPDEEFDANFGSPFFNRKSEGEIVKDKLIGSYLPEAGWYIKLSKDVGGNEWQFKDKIVSYAHWTDLQYEISEFVRQKTKLEMERTGRVINYGSGRYSIVFFNTSGMRGDADTVIMSIDAQEYLLEPPKGFTPGAGMDVNEILKTVQATSLSPAELAKQHFESMKMGMEMAVSKDAKSENANSAMMTAMFSMMGTILSAALGKPAPIPTGPDPMTMMRDMIGTAKDLGVFPDKNQTAPPQKTYVEMINELKAMGIKIGNDNDDMPTMVSKLKDMINLARDLTGGNGGGDTPPLWERVVERHGDKIFSLLGGLTKLAGNAQPQPNVMARPRSAPRIAPTSRPAQTASQAAEELSQEQHDEPYPESIETNDSINPEDKANMLRLINRFAKELKDAVENDRTEKFQYITDTISRFTKDADFKIKIGQYTADNIIAQIIELDGETYADSVMKQKLVSFVNRYIEFVRASVPYYAQCSACHDFAVFDDKADFEEEVDKVCRNDMGNGVECDGTLQACY